MSLTMGRAPFGQHPGGHFNFVPPEHVVYVEDFPRRVRALRSGATVVDSQRVKFVHETGRLPHYAFPVADVAAGAGAEPEPAVDGYVKVPWASADAWYEEDEQVFVHPRDPYHRIDSLATSRHVRVSLRGVELADSTAAVALYETGLPVRFYLPMREVRLGVLEPSDTLTRCAYKGTARHWSVRIGDELVPDVAWTYDNDVQREAEAVRGRFCFYNERVDLEVDGEAQARPQTPWS